MAIESTLIGLAARVVRTLSDTDRDSPDRKEPRERKHKRQRDENRNDTHPIRNIDGQLTGKLIDITA
jgi:hypothetical protein